MEIRLGDLEGPALGPFLFVVILDGIFRGIQGSILWCMLFVDDIVQHCVGCKVEGGGEREGEVVEESIWNAGYVHN